MQNKELVIEMWSGKDYYESRFKTEGVEPQDRAKFTRACAKAAMLDLKSMGVKPDRIRTYYDQGI